MRKTFLAAILALSLSVTFAAAAVADTAAAPAATSKSSSAAASSVKNVKFEKLPASAFDESGSKTAFAVVDGNVLYTRDSGSSVIYGKYDIAKKSSTDIAKIKNFYLSSMKCALQDGLLYTFAASGGDTGSSEIKLYSIDPAAGKMKQLYSDKNQYLAFGIGSMENKIISLKLGTGTKNEGLTSTIFAMDPKANSERAIYKTSTDSSLENGELTLAFDVYKDKMYTLSAKAKGDDGNLYLNTLNSSGKSVSKPIDVTDLFEDIFGDTIRDFKVFGSYVMINNTNDKALLCRINGNKLDVISTTGTLQVVNVLGESRYQLLYDYKGNIVFVVDTETGAIKKSEIPLTDGYANYDIQSDGKTMIINRVKTVGETVKEYYCYANFNDFCKKVLG